jgi:hypothetical protein
MRLVAILLQVQQNLDEAIQDAVSPGYSLSVLP